MAFENKRWLDLVRTGKADEVMKAFGARFKANLPNYYFLAGITHHHHHCIPNIGVIIPIPASEVALNPYF